MSKSKNKFKVYLDWRLLAAIGLILIISTYLAGQKWRSQINELHDQRNSVQKENNELKKTYRVEQ